MISYTCMITFNLYTSYSQITALYTALIMITEYQ